jgi:polyribonucleotide nucleotidyltransferase
MKEKTYAVDIEGKTLSATISDLAGHADGSVVMKMGETVVLVTAVMGDEKPSMGYFPLSVEFEERHYATGQILGSRFVRREGRPSDNATLSGRVIDRTIRPLFDHGIRNEVQVIATVLAVGDDAPDVLGIIGASLALSISDIPWNGPIGAVRMVLDRTSNELVIYPSYDARDVKNARAEFLICGKDGDINMIETGAYELDEDTIVRAFERASFINSKIEQWQKSIIAEIGKAKRAIHVATPSTELTSLFDTDMRAKLVETLFSNRSGKAHLHALKDEWVALAGEKLPEHASMAGDLFEHEVDVELHNGALVRGVRADGRTMDEVRPLFAQAGGVSPVLHGSGIFYRGETHIFTALTLGGPGDSQVIDTMEESDVQKRFMHHYNFPPFSVGEVGRVGGQNRRMIGHGALAEKAVLPVIPPQEQFPYTIRLVSETMSSNGSSSMGSVCGSTLALMDGGVPILRPVAGIASGLMMESREKYVLLTDIQGPEDEHGDMDFKVAGTREGVTAIQMDVKVGGITIPMLAGALEKARLARLHILDTMETEIASPRTDISPRAPKILTVKVLKDQIGLVIGSGGKTINGIREETGVEDITIEEDGTIFITGKNGTAELARDRILALTHIFAVGEVIEDAEVTRIATFGAFVKLNAQNDGLLHISEIVPWRIENLDGILKIGDRVKVVVSKVEEGKIGVSIKKVDPEWGTRKGLKAPEQT